MRWVFAPFSIAGGLLAGLVAAKIFDQIWGLIDKKEHLEISPVKLAAALMLEGAIFRLVRGAFDHGARRGFRRLTGTWPGEEAPEPE
jgi:hypothetical protein